MNGQKISDLIKNLEIALKKYGDLPLIYSKDDEGNSYQEIYYTPNIGTYDFEEREFKITRDDIGNVLCIN